MVGPAQVAIFDMMDPQARVDCLREVKILQSLEHPNIIKCFNSFIQVCTWHTFQITSTPMCVGLGASALHCSAAMDGGFWSIKQLSSSSVCFFHCSTPLSYTAAILAIQRV